MSWVSTTGWKTASLSSEVAFRRTRRSPSMRCDTPRHLILAAFGVDFFSFVFPDAELDFLFSRDSYTTPGIGGVYNVSARCLRPVDNAPTV